MKLPKLCKQKCKSGDRAFVIINGSRFYCGRYRTQKSEEQYLRIVSEWATTKRTPDDSKTEITINDLVTSFLDHAETYYVKNGRGIETYNHFVRISEKLTKLYGSLPVDKFSPATLDTLLQLLIDGRSAVHKQNPQTRTAK